MADASNGIDDAVYPSTTDVKHEKGNRRRSRNQRSRERDNEKAPTHQVMIDLTSQDD